LFANRPWPFRPIFPVALFVAGSAPACGCHRSVRTPMCWRCWMRLREVSFEIRHSEMHPMQQIERVPLPWRFVFSTRSLSSDLGARAFDSTRPQFPSCARGIGADRALRGHARDLGPRRITIGLDSTDRSVRTSRMATWPKLLLYSNAVSSFTLSLLAQRFWDALAIRKIRRTVCQSAPDLVDPGCLAGGDHLGRGATPAWCLLRARPLS